MGLLLQAKSTLKELVKTTKESAFVAIRKGNAIVPLDFLEPVRAVRAVSFLGMALPPHCTAAGKVYLVFETEGGLSRNLPERMEPHTEKTISDRQLLIEQMKEISATGFAVEQGEFNEDISSVAVPVRDYTRMLVGALAIVGPSHRFGAETIAKEIAPAILRAGSDLSKRLGYAE
jgi:DNA-binding IclR family transcriptional regulator